MRSMKSGNLSKLVMPGLGPGIHVFLSVRIKDVDGRDKPGHDDDKCARRCDQYLRYSPISLP